MIIDYIWNMWLILIQNVIFIVTAYISILGLKKELKSTVPETQKNAEQKRLFIRILTIVSFIGSIYIYYDSESSKEALNRKFDALNIRYGQLGKQVSDSSLAQSKLITNSQLQSANQLREAAYSLKNLISGSDSVPIFTFKISSDTILTGNIRNYTNRPVYNFTARIYNFSNVQNCPFYINTATKNKVVKTSCLNSNVYKIGTFTILDAKNSIPFNLPRFNTTIRTNKYVIEIDFKSKIYIEEAIFKNINSYLYQATRIVETSNNKVLKSWIVNTGDAFLKNVNWDKEFPMSDIDVEFREF